MVIATTIDAASDTINAIPSGMSIRPSIPLRKNRGINAVMVIIVALTIDERISTEASYMTFSVPLRSSGGSRC